MSDPSGNAKLSKGSAKVDGGSGPGMTAVAAAILAVVGWNNEDGQRRTGAGSPTHAVVG